jgi:hypothetical protein
MLEAPTETDMATPSLVRSINDYLDAGKLLEWRRELETGVVEQLKRVERARRHLRRELAYAKPEDASLIEAAETLLDAETTSPREADDRLQAQLLQRVRQDVIERVRDAMRGRDDLDALLFFDPDEIRMAYMLRDKLPPAAPRLNEVLRQIACLGGFLARKGDGEPGVKTIWLGLKDVHVAVKAMRALRKFGSQPTCV